MSRSAKDPVSSTVTGKPVPERPIQRLMVVTCQWRQPVITNVFDPKKRTWIKGNPNTFARDDEFLEQKDLIDSNSCLFLRENRGFLVDSWKGNIFTTDDILTGRWNQLNMSRPMKKAGAMVIAACENQVYLFGRTPNDVGEQNVIETFDLDTKEWSAAVNCPPPLPQPLYVLAAFPASRNDNDGFPLHVFGWIYKSSKSTCSEHQHNAHGLVEFVLLQWNGPESPTRGEWKRMPLDPLVAGNTHFVTGFSSQEKIFLGFSDGIYRLKEDGSLVLIGKSLGASESTTLWNGHLVMINGNQVSMFNLTTKRLADLPLLSFNGVYTRSFVASVQCYQLGSLIGTGEARFLMSSKEY